jgi:homoserine kinase
MNKVIVRVPASISNLGPGFDCLGMALRLYNVVTVVRAAKPQIVPEPFGEAAQLFFKRSGIRRFDFGCGATDKVPRARGLGSSASVRL